MLKVELSAITPKGENLLLFCCDVQTGETLALLNSCVFRLHLAVVWISARRRLKELKFGLH